jgi:competence protein ComEC
MADSLIAKEGFLSNYLVGEGIVDHYHQDPEPIFSFNGETVLRIDSTAIYKGISFKPQMVLLQYSPKINLDRLLDTLHPKLVIADASNYKSFVERWKKSCKNKNTIFHYTAEDGAYILSLDATLQQN